MVDRSSSKRCAPIRIRLAVKKKYRVNNLIGKDSSCHEERYRFDSGLIRLIIRNNLSFTFFSMLLFLIMYTKRVYNKKNLLYKNIYINIA